MKFKKILCLIAAAAMVVPALASCGDKKSTAELTQDAEGNYVYSEQVELKIPVYDRGTQGQAPVDDNYWTNYIQTNFGDKHNIKVTFVPITRNDDVAVFNRLLAAGEEPDIIFTYDYPVAMEFYSKGALQEINEEDFKKYAPTYYEYTADTQKYGKLDDKMYFFAATRPDFDSYVKLIRTDWLEKCGLDMPKNREEYYEMLKAFKANNLGGEGTIPDTKVLGNAYYANYDFRDYPMDEKEKALYSDISVASLPYEATKEQLKWDNKLYNEGLVSPNFYLDTDSSQALADFTSGKAGTYEGYLPNQLLFQTLAENCPEAKVDVLAAYDPPTAGRKYWGFGMLSGISARCEHPEAVMMYLEWMVQDENLFVLQNGVEGKTYNMEGDIPMLVTDYTGEERLMNGTNKDLWCLVTESVDYGSEEANKEVQKHTYTPAGYEYLIDEIYAKAEANKPYLYEDTLFTTQITSLSTYKADLLEKWKTYYTDLVTCKPEEFDAKYEQYCTEYLNAGYQAILDEKEKAYDAGQYLKD